VVVAVVADGNVIGAAAAKAAKKGVFLAVAAAALVWR
jgi:hypothetical protein